jgi:hypothetical protein
MLKDKYMYRWQNTAKREQLFEALIKTFTKFEIERVGLGTATSERIERYHESPGEKFDYIVRYNDKEYYVDVTGAWKYPPWTQMSKLEYAKKYGIADRAWIAWLDARRLAFYFILASRALKLSENAKRVKLANEPNEYVVIPLKHWINFRKWVSIITLG